MERVYEELDEVKFENEKLKADIKNKAELLENLKRVQNEQLIKIQEANSTTEKQNHELEEKKMELSELKRANEDLKRSLMEKESILKRVSDANDKLRTEGEDRYRKSEEENRKLMLTLDEANEKNIDLEQKINVYRAEIEGLKGHLAASEKKLMEAEKNAKAPKELRERDDILMKLEEEKSRVEETLKWKREQFKHLEEAHKNLQDQFNTSSKEWERERTALLDEISSLETKLDSQTRILEDLQKKLQMCNNALTQEETRRKRLEMQVSEFKSRYEDAFAECQDARSQLDDLAAKRDEEVAALRHSLSTKEAYYKETNYQNDKLEKENRELLVSLKELQEASIQGSGSSSLSKLKNKLRSLEQIHKQCSANLRGKEAEWSSQLEKMTCEINVYQLQLQSKEAALKEVELELEYCHSSLVEMKLQYEEISVMFLVLTETIYEAGSRLPDFKGEKTIDEEREEKRSLILMKQLEQKDVVLAKARREIEEEREKAASLLIKIEFLNLVEDQNLQMQKEVARCKEMLEESSTNQTRMKEKLREIENDYDEKLGQVCDALDNANSELLEEREKVVELTRQVQSFNVVKEKQLSSEKEIEKYKEMLQDSDKNQVLLEERILQLECDSKEKIKELCGKLNSANAKLAEESEKTASMMRDIGSMHECEEQRQRELENLKEMLEDSTKCQLLLKESIGQAESNSERKLAEVFKALEVANFELTEKISEAHELEFELWVWKSIAERLKADLEQNQNLRKRLEASLLEQVKVGEAIKQERNELADELKAVSSARSKTDASSKSEKETLLRIMREKNEIEEALQREVESLEQESLRRELEGAVFVHITAEGKLENERKILTGLVEKKDQKLHEVEQESKLISSLLEQKKAEADSVNRAWEKMAESKIIAEVEIEEKNMLITGLEEEISNTRKILEMSEKFVSCFRQKASELEAELEMKQDELKEANKQTGEKLRTSDEMVEKLRVEKTNLQEEVSKLWSLVGEFDCEMWKLSSEDKKMMRALESITHRSSGTCDGKENSVSAAIVASPRPAATKQETAIEERSPFRLLN
ncbi:PREDICTED: uncharacterized protein At4g38062 [Tarenaya hassleriana]|uniref:uncharacterized protein At4g38062 n=1 Tax=Tarenaya hassleriana TaxID=28532 RepID=UPI00053C8D11|nr:PREDICTED: uncharacterized protein At4g38062 [Tarenaya hassleriana]XP_010531355.1 PREDICTED: uncharacterized protein At4g38062 [Tarenaya hassleriana]XP_010531356.1 PREDICTED: uncharacterized protein At4g38062 [Tarenaya hassleriana]